MSEHTDAMLIEMQAAAYRSGYEAAQQQAALIAEMGRWRGTKCAPAVIAVGKAIRAMTASEPLLPAGEEKA